MAQEQLEELQELKVKFELLAQQLDETSDDAPEYVSMFNEYCELELAILKIEHPEEYELATQPFY